MQSGNDYRQVVRITQVDSTKSFINFSCGVDDTDSFIQKELQLSNTNIGGHYSETFWNKHHIMPLASIKSKTSGRASTPTIQKVRLGCSVLYTC